MSKKNRISITSDGGLCSLHPSPTTEFGCSNCRGRADLFYKNKSRINTSSYYNCWATDIYNTCVTSIYKF